MYELPLRLFRNSNLCSNMVCHRLSLLNVKSMGHNATEAYHVIISSSAGFFISS